jgi:hypothetical protein
LREWKETLNMKERYTKDKGKEGAVGELDKYVKGEDS